MSCESSHSSEEAPCPLLYIFILLGCLWSLKHKQNARFSDRINEIHLKLFLGQISKICRPTWGFNGPKSPLHKEAVLESLSTMAND